MNIYKRAYTLLLSLLIISVSITGQKKIDRTNVASSLYGSRAQVIQENGQKKDANSVLNGKYDDASAVQLNGIPCTLQIDFPVPVQTNLIRIFPGMIIYAPNLSGDAGIKDYQIEGFNNGYWHPLASAKDQPDYNTSKATSNEGYFYEHNFTPTTVTAVRIIVTRSGHTGKSMSSDKIVPENQRISFIRQVEVYEAGKNSAFGKAFYFNSVVTGDLNLAVYRYQRFASLELTGANTITPFTAKVTVTRENGNTVVEEKKITIVSGNQTVKFDLNLYKDGRYVVNIVPEDPKSIYKGEIKRLMRVDRGDVAKLPVEPISVSDQKIFPVDDYHFVKREGVNTQVKPVDEVIQASKPLAQDRPKQIATGSNALNFDEQGNFVMYFYDANSKGGDVKYHYTFSKDLKNWQIADKSPTGKPNKILVPPYKPLPYAAVSQWKEKTKLAAANVIFYDAARDGVPPLNEVRVQWFPPFLCDATKYGLIKWGTYPVWEKRPGEWLVLTKEPLIVDKFQFDSEELETEQSSNDNFGPQYLSDDGKTLYYPRAAKLRRFAPYTIEYDNIPQAHRIMRTHYTQDGINWKVRYLVLPEETDHWSYQHYGVHTFRVDKDYYIGYLHAYHCANQQIYTEIIYSRDGLNWNRVTNSKPFIANGGIGSWSFGMIFTQSVPLELNGKYYLPLGHVTKHHHYYVTPGKEDVSFVTADYLKRSFEGRNLTKQWPYFNEIGGWEGLAKDMHNYNASVGLATFRKDAWMVVKAETTGEMLSRVFTAKDNNLQMNAITGKGGEIRIEVLNADGTTISEYCGKNAAVFNGDGTDVLIKWSKGSIQSLPDVPFRLRISMKKAEVYCFNFIRSK